MGTDPILYDIVIYGITGFTGRLILEYFLTNKETASFSKVKWAIAGRNEQKIRTILTNLKHPDIPIIIANAQNAKEVEALVKQTKVILSVAGPYALYGTYLIQYCVQYGRHICDLTGEIHWMQKILKTYETQAQQTGAKIVHCCGFESIPPDLATWLLVQKLRNQKITKISYLITKLKAGISGGTIASFFNFMEENQHNMKEIHALRQRPYALCNLPIENQPTLPPNKLIEYDPYIQRYKSIFANSMLDRLVIYRTNYILQYAYGKSFVFESCLALDSRLRQFILVVLMLLLAGLSVWSWTRNLIKKILPSSGQGPSPTELKTGCFEGTAIAFSEEKELGRCIVTGKEEPGYQLTAKMISECAICLALNETEGSKQGGFYTPAAIFGDKLIKRLEEKEILKFDLCV